MREAEEKVYREESAKLDRARKLKEQEAEEIAEKQKKKGWW